MWTNGLWAESVPSKSADKAPSQRAHTLLTRLHNYTDWLWKRGNISNLHWDQDLQQKAQRWRFQPLNTCQAVSFMFESAARILRRTFYAVLTSAFNKLLMCILLQPDIWAVASTFTQFHSNVSKQISEVLFSPPGKQNGEMGWKHNLLCQGNKVHASSVRLRLNRQLNCRAPHHTLQWYCRQHFSLGSSVHAP